MKYIIFSLHGFIELFKRKGEKTLFEYAEKGKFEEFIENGIWGYLFLERKIEESYFKIFTQKNFPGEGFLRCLKYEINYKKTDTFFLGDFVFLCDDRVIETDINLNLNEKKQLIEEIERKIKDFEFFLFENDLILKFQKDLPVRENSFPNRIKNKNLKEILFKGEGFEEINNFMIETNKILISHPVNKVRSQLYEPCGNFLYLYGMGKFEEKYLLSDEIKRETFYFSDKKLLDGLGKFLGFEKIDRFSDIKDNSLYWFNLSLDYKTSPSIWVKNFENFSKEILKNFSYEEDIRYLFIFDPFMDENFEYESGISLFLGVNFSEKLKKKYKNPYLLFQKFIK